MEKELFLASDKKAIVKVLGIRIDCKLEDIRFYINGQDITDSVVLEEVRIVMEKTGE